MRELPLGKAGVCTRGKAESEADHLMECPDCGEVFDMRDLRQVFDHIHGPIEILTEH